MAFPNVLPSANRANVHEKTFDCQYFCNWQRITQLYAKVLGYLFLSPKPAVERFQQGDSVAIGRKEMHRQIVDGFTIFHLCRCTTAAKSTVKRLCVPRLRWFVRLKRHMTQSTTMSSSSMRASVMHVHNDRLRSLTLEIRTNGTEQNKTLRHVASRRPRRCRKGLLYW